MDDDVIVAFGLFQALFDADIVRRAIEQFGIGHQCGRLRQPCRIPIAGDLAPRLVTRARPAIEAIERRWTKEECFAHAIKIRLPVAAAITRL